MSDKMNIARTLLVITVMVASAILPVMPEAAELKEMDKASHTVASVVLMPGATALDIYEDECDWYEIQLDEAPDGLLVVTPTADSALVSISPSYLKFSKQNWDWGQGLEVCVDVDDDGADLSATISHALSGTATTASWGTIASLSVNGIDIDIDTDGDGVQDDLDSDDDGDGVADDAEEYGCDLIADCDGDSYTDDLDAFVYDPTEWNDTDGDGTGDNADAFPDDACADTDSDMDMAPDWVDDTDADNDSVADCVTTLLVDAFPYDPLETADADGDGVGDNADAFDADENETTDSDNDTVGDNSDAFPNDANESADSDGDGIGDNADLFDNDPTEWNDTDGDGVGDNSDWNATDGNEDTDSDGDGTGDNADADDDGDGVADASENTGCELDPDCDGDGYNDSADAFPLDANASMDTDGDGLADDIIVTGAAYSLDFEDGAFPTYVTWTDSGDAAWGISNDSVLGGTFSAQAGTITHSQTSELSIDATTGDGIMSFDWMVSSEANWDELWFYVDGTAVAGGNDWSGYTSVYDTTHPNWGGWGGYYGTTAMFLCANGGTTYLHWVNDGWTDCSDASDEGVAAADIPGQVSMGLEGTFNYTLTAGSHTFTWTYLKDGSGSSGDDTAWIDNVYIPVLAGTSGAIGPTATTAGTASDSDDDGDGYSDADETTNCAATSDPLNASDTPANDNDADYLCDAMDDDDDNDGVLDANEADGAGIGTNGTDVDCTMTDDCDGDTYTDDVDTHPIDSTEWTDMDGDGIGDNSDSDRDGDGYGNSNDAFPDDATESTDNDGDGIGDNADDDDDTCATSTTCGTYTGMGNDINDFYPGDGVDDANDSFPLNPADAYNTDGDAWGNNIDYDDDNDGLADNTDEDDDNDGYSDADEGTPAFGNISAVAGQCGSGDSGDASVTPDDMDGDLSCDPLDIDRDGDGTNNTEDPFPDDECADTDTDGDGMPDDIESGCTSTLIADDDDDYNSGNAPTVDFVVSVGNCDSYDYNYGEGSVYIDGSFEYNAYGDYDCYSSSAAGQYVIGTYTVASGSSLTVDVYDDYSDGEMLAWVQVDGVTVCGPIGDWMDWYGVRYYDTTCVIPADDFISAVSWTDAEEEDCGTDPADANDQPTDMDGDEICDPMDDDIDGDGFTNLDEEVNCGEANDANLSTDTPSDMDSDGICDALDDDQDGDNVTNANDDFPADSTEWTDTDGDGTGDEADTDDDNDTVLDTEDDFPLDACADTDTDNDGEPDSIAANCTTTLVADDDDDGDYWSDSDEASCSGGDATNGSVEPDDNDGDDICDTNDDDDDNDGLNDTDEGDGTGIGPNGTDVDCTLTDDCDGDGLDDLTEGAACSISLDCDGDNTNDTEDDFPEDASEDTDTDNDGTGDNADTDDDGDGYSDADEVTNCGENTDPLDSSDTPTDTDGDYECDAVDFDDDGDFLPDAYDDCPLDPSGFTDNDGDGLCDESDTDDDDDGTPDTEDCAPMDGSMADDWDGDGLCDEVDADDDGDGIDDSVDGVNGSMAYDFDNDGWDDDEEAACGYNASDSSDSPPDNDDDGTCDENDSDDDNDGVDDSSDDYTFDTDATTDTDGDGLADTITSIDSSTVGNWTLSWTDDPGYPVISIIATTVAANGTTSDSCSGGGAGMAYVYGAGSCVIAIEEGGMAEFTFFLPYSSSWTTLTLTSPGGDSTTIAGFLQSATGLESPVWHNIHTASSFGTGLDLDDDDDGYLDVDEITNCASGDSLDANVTPPDNDGDGLCDVLDDDDDNDGYSDSHEAACGETNSTDGLSPVDTDWDGECDALDDDDDNDGTDDADDAYPLDASEDSDTDSDGTGDNADDDADGDGVPDADDPEPTDRCSTSDLDGDGLVDDYEDCSTLGFYSTINKGEGGNAGLGLEDGDYVGITTSDGYYGDLFTGDDADNQFFEISDTDGVFRIYFDPADDVTWVSFDYAFSSTTWEAADYAAVSWIDDSGTTTLLQDTRDDYDNDIDNCQCEGYWDTAWWFLPDHVSNFDGQMVIEFSSTFTTEVLGIDNVVYYDMYMEEIVSTGFEDPVENLGGFYTAPAVPTEYDTTHPAYSASYFMCADGSTGFSMSYVPSWLSDGWVDCADASDEDPTYYDGLVLPTDELFLYNGGGSTVTLDVSSYYTGTVDDDDDGDGVLDDDDAFPMDGSESEDLDGDGTGDNSDGDVDGDGVPNGDDAFPRHPYADTDTDGDGMPDVIHDYTGEITEDFSTGNFSGLDWTIADDPLNTGWVCVADCYFYVPSGTETATAATWLDHNESTTLGTTLDTGEGMFSFDYTVSSEERYDEFMFFYDGQLMLAESGQDHDDFFVCEAEGAFVDSYTGHHYINGNWVNDGIDDCGDADQNGVADDEEVSDWYAPHEGTFEMHITAGSHTFTWAYAKDGDSDGGDDSATVDNIVFPYELYGDIGECPVDDTTGLCNIEDDNDDGDALDDASDPCPDQGDETVDTDGDGICDIQDTDDDGDGVYDINDPFPLDGTEWKDDDGDGIGDNSDPDDDNDGYDDDVDSHPNNPDEWSDADGDGWGDNGDPDDDNDGYFDDVDLWPYDQTQAVDTDGDGIPDWTYAVQAGGSFNFESGVLANGSGWDNNISAFPWVFTTDSIQGNFSLESTNVGVQSTTSSIDLAFFASAGDVTFQYIVSSEFQSSCVWDGLRVLVDGMNAWSVCGEDSGMATIAVTPGQHTITFEFYKDFVIDGGQDKAWIDNINLPDTLVEMQADTDDDGDGVADEDDIAPLDACISTDFDGDGIPDDVGDGCSQLADFDDDNDMWWDDAEEECGSNPLDANETPVDMDYDGICDNLDWDLDEDGFVNLVVDCFASDWFDDVNYCSMNLFNFMDWDDDGEISEMEAYVFFVMGLGYTEDEWNDTLAESLLFDSDDNGNLSWDEFFNLQLASGDIPADATNPGWFGDYVTWDLFPWDPTEHADFDGDGIGDNADSDDDGDGVNDLNDSFPWDPTEWADLDGDGIGDNSDDDTDGDGVNNTNDQFDMDADASLDSDNDGADDASDTDDDNDGVPDTTDLFPLNPSEWSDNDGDCGTILPEDQTETSGDGCGDGDDIDDDNDGVIDSIDDFQYDATESVDTDGDGIGDNSDPNIDGDVTPNYPLDAFEMDASEWMDSDNDTVGDNADTDDDGDGYDDDLDAFPLNPAEWADMDGDGIGDNSDTDVDGDGVDNSLDPFPEDDGEYADTDTDGTGDEADTDDDGDGYLDTDEEACGTNSKSPTSKPSDFDGDGLCDALDTTDSRSEADKELNAQADPGFTPGFPSLVAVVSLMGAALMGRRKED